VRAPYKITGAVLIFSVLLTGAATNFYPGEKMKPGAIAWFCLGATLYVVAYYLFYVVVKVQYGRLVVMTANTEAKKSFMPLKLALYTFFSIWIIFPIVWLLGYHGLNILTNDAQECLHCACDLIAKSFYGFVLAKYRRYFDKKMWDLLEELGMDAEAGLEVLEKDLKALENPNQMSEFGRRLSAHSIMAGQKDHKHDYDLGGYSNNFSESYRNQPSGHSSPRAQNNEMDALKNQLAAIHQQMNELHTRKDDIAQRKP
jgi:hypothetical protein